MNQNLSANARRDIKLVTEVISGDTKVLNQLIKIYTASIYLVIVKLVYHKEVAKELTNEVFEKAFFNIHQFESNTPFSSWLYRIAHNHAIDHLRKKKGVGSCLVIPNSYIKRIDEENQDKINSYIDNPEEVMIKDEKAEILRKVVSDLQPMYRQLLEMRYFAEYTYDEISDELKIPVGTVKVTLFRSRKLLFEMLKNSEINCS